MIDQAKTLERVSHLYAALRHINRAIVRTHSPSELFVEVCCAAVEHGEFVSALIGLPDRALLAIVPAEQRGARLEPSPLGDRISASAYRTGTHQVRNDSAESDLWWTQASKLGIRSGAALPIRCREEICGVFSVYSAQPDYFQNEEIAFLEEAAEDISFALGNFAREDERSRADVIVKRFAAIVESTNDAIVSKTVDGFITSWNPAAERMFGYSAAEIIGRNILILIPPDRASEEPMILSRIARGERIVDVETVRIRKNGSQFPVSITISPINSADGTIIGASKIVRDITERKEAAEALRLATLNLEQRVRERTAELAVAKERAESADLLKSAFLATMSHELRTPLNSIIGFTGLIIQEMAGPLNPEQSKQLLMVQGSARHLLSVINDVLDISKIEAGQLEVYSEAFDFLAAAEKVVGSMQPMSRVKGLELTLTAPAGLPPLISDRRRVEQILLNLLNNAIKFTARGTVSLKVELLESYTMRTAAKAQRCIQFQVADTGIGIRPEHLPNLFKPFQQIDSGLTRMHEGTGLGLSICRRLVELLHGDIHLNSEFRVGTAVTVTLPLASSGS